MKCHLSVLFSCLVLFHCQAAGPTPCESPAQWTGSSSAYDHANGQHNYYNLTYDADQQRIRIREEVRADRPGRIYYEWLLLYKQQTFYEINLQTTQCNQIREPRPWHAYRIPPNATFEHEYYVGVGNSTLKVQEWSDRITGPSQPETWSGTFTVDGCVPVTEVLIEREANRSSSSIFYNIIAGPLSPNAFTPPSQCPPVNDG